MSEKEEPTGFIGAVRRLSRRLSGTILSPDARDVKAYLVRNDRRNIYSYDSEDQMRIGGILAKDLAEEYGTPLYVYDVNRIVDNYNLYHTPVKNVKNFQLCYAVKANPNLTILNIFARLGAGFDVTSGGEISRCLAAGVDPSKIIFNGCGKTVEEIELAVKNDIHCINVESWDELDRIEAVADRLNKIQNISIRINADLSYGVGGHHDGGGHSSGQQQHVPPNKFGVPITEALEIYSRAKASSNLKIKGISCHLGSNITQLEPFLEARDKLLHLADELRQESRICVEHINLGGGFAAPSGSESPDIPAWVEKLTKPVTERGLKLILEPGRSLVIDAGVLLTKVEYVKRPHKEPTSGTTSPRTGSFISASPHLKASHAHKQTPTYAIVDAGLNDFCRPIYYGEQHQIVPSVIRNEAALAAGGGGAGGGSTATGITEYKYDIVGPISDSIDVFYKDLILGQQILAGDYVIITDVGAYGSSMANNYNSRNKIAEVAINDSQPVLIRERETYQDQYLKEKICADFTLKPSNDVIEEAESQEDLSNVTAAASATAAAAANSNSNVKADTANSN